MKMNAKSLPFPDINETPPLGFRVSKKRVVRTFLGVIMLRAVHTDSTALSPKRKLSKNIFQTFSKQISFQA